MRKFPLPPGSSPLPPGSSNTSSTKVSTANIIVEFQDKGLVQPRSIRVCKAGDECDVEQISTIVKQRCSTSRVVLETSQLEHNYELRTNGELFEYINDQVEHEHKRFDEEEHQPVTIVLKARSLSGPHTGRKTGSQNGGGNKLSSFTRKPLSSSATSPARISAVSTASETIGNEIEDEFQDEDEHEDLSTLGKLKQLFPHDRSNLTLSYLEDQLSAYRISWGSWNVESSNKTIEDLFEEIRNNSCDLYTDDLGVIRIVRLVRVKIVEPDSKHILVNIMKMMDQKKHHSKVHSLPAYKCKRGESPYHAALRNVQQELGHGLWGPVNSIESMYTSSKSAMAESITSTISRDPHARRANVVLQSTILDHIEPTGFERPTHEFRDSRSFPGLRTAYYIHTLALYMKSTRVPRRGSFTVIDQQRPGVIRLWQWMPPDHVNRTILGNQTTTEVSTKQEKATSPTGPGSPQQASMHQLFDDPKNSPPAEPALPFQDSLRGKHLLEYRAARYRQRLAAMDGPLASSIFSRISEFWYKENVQPTLSERHQQEAERNLAYHYTLPVPSELTDISLGNWLQCYGVNVSLWGKGQAKKVQQLVDEVINGESSLHLTEVTELAQRPSAASPVFTQGKDLPVRAAVQNKALRKQHAVMSYHQPRLNLAKKPLRVIHVAKVELVHEKNPNLVLVETHQRLEDSRLRVRFKSLAEKFKPNETARDATFRGIYEELIAPSIYLVDQDGNKLIIQRPSHEESKRSIRVLSIHAPKVEILQSPSYPGLETRYHLHVFRCVMSFLPDEPFCTEEPRPHNDGAIVHFWRWETRQIINAMTNSLINQVRFYFHLVPPAKRDFNVLKNWFFEAAETDQVDVIKLLCAPQNANGNQIEDQDDFTRRFVSVDHNPPHEEEEEQDQWEKEGYASQPRRNSSLAKKRLGILDPSSPDVRDTQGRSAVRVAALHKAYNAVDALIRICLENAQIKAEETPKTPRNEKLQQLDADAINQPEIVSFDSEVPCTLIYYAAIANKVELVKHLLGSNSVAVNSVCLHSCVSCGSVDVLEVLLPRLRYDPLARSSTARRLLFGVELHTALNLNDPEVRKNYSVDLPRADNFQYFESLLVHIELELSVAAKAGSKLIWKSELEKDTRAILAPPLKALEVVLQYCNPTASSYRTFLLLYLHKVIELDDQSEETRIFRRFVARSRFPLHIGLMCAHVLRSVFGLEKRFWDSYQAHADSFQDLVCEILDCCEDQDEAEELLRERADIPAWRRDNGEFSSRSMAHRHKTTCAYLAVKYRLKRVVAHKFFTTQNDSIWFNDAHDSLYTRGLGSLAKLSASVFPLFKQGNHNETPIGNYILARSSQRFEVDRKTNLEGFVSYILRVPGFKTAVQGTYRVCVSIGLLVFLVLLTPVLWFLPFSPSLRIIVDIPRTEFACCYFKWSVWSMSYVTYLFAFAYLAIANSNGKASTMWNAELVLFIFFLGNFVGIIEQIAEIGFGPFMQHSVNLVDLISCLMITAAFCVDKSSSAYDILMSIGAILSTFRLFHLFSASKELGPLWITMQYVVWDVIRFLAFLAVVLIAFILAFVFLLGGAGVPGFETAGETFSSLIWSVFEAFTTYDPTQPYRTQLYQVFLFGFLLIAAVLLTNLLIAMMTRRFEQVAQTARVQWLYALAQLIEKYSLMPIAPSPFNLLTCVPNLIFLLRNRKQSLYDPSHTGKKPDKKTAVVPMPSEDLWTDVLKREIEQVLSFRCTRRAVVTRYIRQEKLRVARNRATEHSLEYLTNAVNQILWWQQDPDYGTI